MEAYSDITSVLLGICLMKQKLQEAWRDLCGRQSVGSSLLRFLPPGFFLLLFMKLEIFFVCNSCISDMDMI